MTDDERLAAGLLHVPPWPPPDSDARGEQFERHRPARVAGEGVLFSVWSGAHHRMCFVTGDALSALAGQLLSPAQWLSAYRAHVRRLHAVSRELITYRSDLREPILVTTSAVAGYVKAQEPVGYRTWKRKR